MISIMRTTAVRLITPVAAAIVLLSAMAAGAQEDTGERAVIDIIQVLHREPDRIRESVRPALDPRGSIGQIDDKLIIATTAANLQRLKDIIAETDVPPRRLIIGVDFAYSSGIGDAETDSNGQQQSQAIEGQELVFVGNASDADATDMPRITIAAEILGSAGSLDQASVNVRLDNVPGLTGNHILRLPLGTWQPIEVPMSDPGSENDTDGVTDADADVDDETVAITAVVAVRVDRVP